MTESAEISSGRTEATGQRLLARVLGPSAGAVGEALLRYPEYRLRNAERIVERTAGCWPAAALLRDVTTALLPGRKLLPAQFAADSEVDENDAMSHAIGGLIRLRLLDDTFFYNDSLVRVISSITGMELYGWAQGLPGLSPRSFASKAQPFGLDAGIPRLSSVSFPSLPEQPGASRQEAEADTGTAASPPGSGTGHARLLTGFSVNATELISGYSGSLPLQSF